MIELLDASLQRGGRWLFRNVDLRIHPGWKVGLTGANGCGKSSLLAILSGALDLDQGNLTRPSGWRTAVTEQEVLGGQVSALEYVTQGDEALFDLESRIADAEASGLTETLPDLHAQLDAIDGYAARSRAERVLEGLGIGDSERDRSVQSFSGGWRVRLNLARALLARADLLLLDEPTNHLDLDAVFWLEDWLKRFPGTLLVVSHDREFLDGVVGHIVHMEDLGVFLSAGNYSDFERRRAEALQRRAKLHARQERERLRLHRFVERFRAKATKARQAQSRVKQLERMEQVAPVHSSTPFRFAFPRADTPPNPMLRMDRVSMGYGAHPILANVSLDLRPGERIGLLGRNGAGKSTFVRTLSGSLRPIAGDWEMAPGLRVGYFAQHQLEQLDMEATPVRHLLRRWPDLGEQGARDRLGRFGFSGDRANEAVESFSGGEKSRLALAMQVQAAPQLLLLDEPTNHLDMEMRHALAVALQAYDGALVLVSHDRFLLGSCCDRVLLVSNGHVSPFDGDLEDYHRWLKENLAPAPGLVSPRTDIPRRTQRRSQAKERQSAAVRRRPLELRLREIETKLEYLEQERIELEAQLAEPSIYQTDNASRLVSISRRRGELGAEIESVETEWLEASELLEDEISKR